MRLPAHWRRRGQVARHFQRSHFVNRMLVVAACLVALAAPMAARAQAPAPGQATSPAQPVTLDTFVRAETDRYFATYVRMGAFGRLVHARALAPIEKQDVVRMNRDTLYSSGVFDLEAGPVTVELPGPGRRFMSLQVISQDHYTTEVVYAPGRYTYTAAGIGARYVFLLVRTLVDPESSDDVAAANALQDAIRVEQASPGRFEVPAWDTASLDGIRKALSALGAYGGKGVRFGRRGEVDPVAHLIGTAMGWGGNPDAAAIYRSVFPASNDGTVVHTLRVTDVPVDGFWSISLYNKDGFYEKNALGAYSVNDITATRAADGSIVVQFGGCDGRVPNCLPIMPGWNYIVRLYRPRPAILDATWTFPAAVPVR